MNNTSSTNDKLKIIFFGNGPLSEYALQYFQSCQNLEIIFHAKTSADLAKVTELKTKFPDAYGILASFGVIIRPDLLKLFEPVGILNIHPSLLPKYRGASPIESAILAGDTEFSYSIMKLAKAMDAGPIYHQETYSDLELNKTCIYKTLAEAGAKWLCENLPKIQDLTPAPQDSKAATFCGKLDKSMSFLHPDKYTAEEIFRQIVAYQTYPKPKYQFYDKTCIITKAHVLRVADILCEAVGLDGKDSSPLMLKCADRNFVVIDELQPEGKRPMDALSFMNGYAKPRN